MDPDAEAEQAASLFIRSTFITVAFTTCHHYASNQFSSGSQVFSPPLEKKERVLTPKPAETSKKKKKTIYLTFDDGPNKGTEKMMNIIKEEEVPVTLFIIGEHVYGSQAQAAIFDSLVNSRYFEIANHSYTHGSHNRFNSYYQVPDSVVSDFVRCADSLGLTANIIRTPGRNVWRTANISSTDIKTTKPAADTLANRNFTIVGWDLEWHYGGQLALRQTSDQLYSQVDSMFIHNRTKTPDHLVLLAHDQVYHDSNDSTQLHQFIKKLKASGEYEFETVSKYPGLKN